MNVYEQMINDLNTNGWGKGTLYAGESSCILGARNRALNNYLLSYDSDEHSFKLAKIIKEQFPNSLEYFTERDYEKHSAEVCYSFNDLKETTKEDVILVLEKAAASEN